MAGQKLPKTFDVSIILNAYDEGRGMQPTVRSLALAMGRALDEGLSVELIIILDGSDQLTAKYVDQNIPALISSQIPLTFRQVDFLDLSQSRNYGISLAKGKYIGAVDADDLFSQNLITASVATIKKYDRPVVVHPEYVLSFGGHNEIYHTQNSTDKEFDKASLVEYNYWSSLSFTVRELREKYPYKATNKNEGFGPEDWQWNADTLGAGIDHVVAPRTVLFYRRKLVGSLAMAHHSGRSLLYKTDILRDATNALAQPLQPTEVKAEGLVASESRPKTVPQRLSTAPRLVLAKTGKVVGPALRRHKRTQAFEHHMRLALSELFATSSDPVPVPVKPFVPPEWLIEEWRRQHAFEHRLFPDPVTLQQLREYLPQASAFTAVYWDLLKKMQLDPDYLFLVPWLKTGGADLVILNYVKGILAANPNAKITVLATELTDSPWKTLLPGSVQFVTLNEAFYSLAEEQQTRLLGTLLVQLAPKHLHVINSFIGHRLFGEYAKSLSKVTRLYVSLFSVDHLASGRRVHGLLDHLSHSIDYIQKVLTDNQHIIDNFVLWLALPKDKFAVEYQPYSGTVIRRQTPAAGFADGNPLKVLWAGRLDREKRPDVLIKIASESKRQGLPIEFHVYGSRVLDDKNDIVERLEACSNIIYQGAFSKGVNNLPLKNYQLFLMTSEYEGMPNVLFEATGGGLPVMAPAVGGIPEFIQAGKTGYLVPRFDNVHEYVDYLKEFIASPTRGYNYLANAQNLLEARHSWKSFVDTLIEDGYTDLNSG